MRPTSTLLQLAMCLSSLSSLGLASLPGPDAALAVRQEEETSRTQESSRSTITNPPSTETEESPRESNTREQDGNGSRTSSGDDGDRETSTTGTRTGTSGTQTRGPTRTRYPPDAPPGGVSLQTPATLVEPTPLYKISDHVTFGWNYTSLRGTPTAVDVLVSCAEASRTWTLAPNMTFETDVSFVWNTREDADDVEAGGLLTELYTLIVKEADTDITDIPSPGYLGAYTGFTFGLYAGIPYTPYPEWTCPGCSAGASILDRQAVGFALTMAVVTTLSFTWFIGGLGLN